MQPCANVHAQETETPAVIVVQAGPPVSIASHGRWSRPSSLFSPTRSWSSQVMCTVGCDVMISIFCAPMIMMNIIHAIVHSR